MNHKNPGNEDWLLARSEVVEQPFESSLPLVGPLIAWFRTRWNNVATRWYVRPMVKQQNDFNRQLVERVRDFETYSYEVTSEQDRDLGRIRHDVAALQVQLQDLNRRLKTLDNKLAVSGQENEGAGDPEEK
jgi:hypothetical protein